MDRLTPFRPTADDPWDLAKAAHLARRAGFGASEAELARLVNLGVEGAVDRLVDFPDTDRQLEQDLEAAGPELDIRLNTGSYGAPVTDRLRRWWLFRMVHGRHPLQEKLTLLWHDHFACQESKVIRARLVLQQNALFRQHAAGSFGDLLRAVARNPAMLVFLDNRISEKGKPNENWARELLELFTLGVDRYTQHDIIELARIFTGWTTPELDSNEFRFVPGMHDTGDKQVFGSRIAGRVGSAGIKEGDEAIALILANPHCARFIAGRLRSWFVTHSESPEADEELAELLLQNGYSIRETLRALFRSAWFYESNHHFALYRNPTELVVGVARALELQNAHLAGLEGHTLRMGMELYEPPSVAGWDHGEAWVRAGSVAPRFRFAIDCSELPHAARAITGRATVDLDRTVGYEPEAGELSAQALVRQLAKRVLQRSLSGPQEAAVVEFISDETPPPADAKEARRHRRSRIRAALHLILTAPELAYA